MGQETPTAQSCIDLLRQIRDVSFATVDEKGAPQIRIIDIMLAEPGAVVFCTARGKDFYRQLTHDGRVAVCGLTRDFKMISLSGRARRLPDADQRAWVDRIFEANPSMNDVYPGDARYVLEAFALDNGDLEFFDLGVSPINRCSPPPAASASPTPASAAAPARASARRARSWREGPASRTASTRATACTAASASRGARSARSSAGRWPR